MAKERLTNHEPAPHDHPDHPDFKVRDQAFGRLKIAFGISVSLIILELLGAFFSESLALLADAGHVTADAVALGITLLAAYLAKTLQSSKRSYGYYRLEIIAAFVNGVFLICMAVFIVIEALERLHHEHTINASIMLGVGSLGLAANLLMLWIMGDKHQHNLNLKGAFLHVLGDTLASVAVVVGAVFILFTGHSWPDTLASAFVAVMIVSMAARLVWDSMHVLLEGTPKHMDPDEIQERLKKEFPSIINIHDFHVWEITSNLFAMTAHIEADVKDLRETQSLIDGANQLIRKNYGIGHTTFQVEPRLEESSPEG
jgi:cobalt-zinc-cadmium efflux system protein